MKKLKKILLSNDDGISSPFLGETLKSLSQYCDELICIVPSRERSWIGRAFSRHEKLSLKEEISFSEIENLKCYSLNGTPSDCVNIALSYIAPDVDAVVSGINIGQNITMPLLWCSGTFSAAVEGAGFGIPSFACSLQLDKKFYEACRLRHEEPAEDLKKVLRASCDHAAAYVCDAVMNKNIGKWEVHNLNYPSNFSKDSEFVKCSPAKTKLMPLYKKNQDGDFEFAYSLGDIVEDKGSVSDLECMQKSQASVSVIRVF